MTLRPACILDLDGTLVRAFPEGDTTRGPRRVEEAEILPGTRLAIAQLHTAGFLCVVVTNKPDVARGIVGRKAVCAIHRVVQRALGLGHNQIYFCPHDDADGCDCRKPRPRLILDAARDHDIDLARSWLIGDRDTDIQAAHAAGIHNTAKIDTNEGILRAVRWIIKHGGRDGSQKPESETVL